MKRHWQQRQSINTTLNFSDNIDAMFSIYFKLSIYYHVMIVISTIDCSKFISYL